MLQVLQALVQLSQHRSTTEQVPAKLACGPCAYLPSPPAPAPRGCAAACDALFACLSCAVH